MSVCHHRRWKSRACLEPHHIAYACTDCGRLFMLPLLLAKPRLRWLKQALRLARSMQPPLRLAEVPCLAQDVSYIHAMLWHAGHACEVPQFSSVLLVRGSGGKRPGPSG